MHKWQHAKRVRDAERAEEEEQRAMLLDEVRHRDLVCIHVCVCVCMHACMRTHGIHTHTCTHAHMHARTPARTRDA